MSKSAKELIKDHLRQKKVTHWVNWDLTDEEDLEAAAEWLFKEFVAIENMLNDNYT